MSIQPSLPPPDIPGLRRGWYDPTTRVSDADRGEVIDRLSAHYSDGRLDHDEFSQRLDLAMSAKTMADLGALLTDLPGSKPAPAVQLTGSRRHQRQMLRLQIQHQRLQIRQQLHEQRRAERQQRFRALRWLPIILAVLVAALIVVHTLTHSVIAWVLLAIVALAWLSRNAGNYRRHE
jgi:hypothetical protein